jgi:uncharacterized protein (TIGR02246 family)
LACVLDRRFSICFKEKEGIGYFPSDFQPRRGLMKRFAFPFYLITFTVSLFIGFLGCQKKSDMPMEPAAAKELCTRLWTDYIETVKTMDPNRIAAWFAKDAVLIYPEMAELRGHETIQAFFRKALPGVKVLEMTFILIHFDVVGPRVYTFATVDELEQASANPPAHALTRCGVVWERQTDGSWKISHFLLNYINL